jgi:hypothetical protein
MVNCCCCFFFLLPCIFHYKFNICHLNAKMEMDACIASLARLHSAIFCNFVANIGFNRIEDIQRIMI